MKKFVEKSCKNGVFSCLFCGDGGKWRKVVKWRKKRQVKNSNSSNQFLVCDYVSVEADNELIVLYRGWCSVAVVVEGEKWKKWVLKYVFGILNGKMASWLSSTPRVDTALTVARVKFGVIMRNAKGKHFWRGQRQLPAHNESLRPRRRRHRPAGEGGAVWRRVRVTCQGACTWS